MNSKKYNFQLTNNNNNYNNNDKVEITSFYQICQYPINGMVWVRKLMVDNFGYMQYKCKKYNTKIINKFIKNIPENKLSVYPTHTLDLVPFPSGGEILAAKSTILNSNPEYSGYALWD